MKAPKKTQGICYLSLAACALIASMCLFVLNIDIHNNYNVGARYSHELAQLMAAGAVAFVTFPAVAAIIGRWNWVLAVCTAAFGLLTLGSAYMANTSGINRGIGDISTAQAQASTARQKRERAEADLADAKRRIGETSERMSAADLRQLHANAQAIIARESSPERGGCKARKRDGTESECAKAEREAASLLRRIGEAGAREKAEADLARARAALDQVEVAADAAAPSQELAAVDIAAHIGGTPEDAARIIGRIIGVLSLVVTAGLGLAAETATALGLHAFGIVPLSKRGSAQAEQPAAPQQPAPTVSRAGIGGRRKMTKQERIAQFAAARLRKVEGEAPGLQAGEIAAALAEWWRSKGISEPMPSPNVIATVLTDGCGFTKCKRGGVIRYAAKFAE